MVRTTAAMILAFRNVYKIQWIGKDWGPAVKISRWEPSVRQIEADVEALCQGAKGRILALLLCHAF